MGVLSSLFPRLPGRGAQPPEGLRAAAGGRLLAWATARDGSHLGGTRDHLVLALVGSEPVVLPWEQVLRADWDVEERALQVEQVQDWGRPVVRWSFHLDEPGAVLVLVRERVSASVVLQRRVPVRGRRGLTIVGRRPPSGGAITWSYVLDSGIEPTDPEVVARADQALADAQESLGLR